MSKMTQDDLKFKTQVLVLNSQTSHSHPPSSAHQMSQELDGCFWGRVKYVLSFLKMEVFLL